ncbi:SDA1 domain-containing protein [Chytridium lagenaria]|nr:SDA1 domain-containing protein [Chytridium lagenaria]
MGMVVQAIADNFVVTAGLNSLREVCARCPLAMSETLLQSLMDDYKNNKEKSAMVAGRSLLGLFREINPLLLKKRDRGKGVTVNIKEFSARKYGEVTVHETIDGADLFARKVANGDDRGGDEDEEGRKGTVTMRNGRTRLSLRMRRKKESPRRVGRRIRKSDVEDDDAWAGWEEASLDSDDAESGGEWEDLNGSDVEEGEEGEEDDAESDAKDGEDGEDEDEPHSPRKKLKTAPKKRPAIGPKQAKYLEKMGRTSGLQEKDEAMALEAKTMATTQIFTDEQFVKMKELATQRRAEKMVGARPGSFKDEEDDDSEEEDPNIVDVRRITSGVKRKMTYDERLEHAQAGREGRAKFGSRMGLKKEEKGSSTTNREKEKKTKAFMMIVHKRTVKGKAKRSLREKQKILRAHITKQKKKGH